MYDVLCPCVIYFSGVGANSQILLGVNPDLVRFECVVRGAFAAVQKIRKLENLYSWSPKHTSGYHYCSGKDWCDFWIKQASEGYQVSFND